MIIQFLKIKQTCFWCWKHKCLCTENATNNNDDDRYVNGLTLLLLVCNMHAWCDLCDYTQILPWTSLDFFVFLMWLCVCVLVFVFFIDVMMNCKNYQFHVLFLNIFHPKNTNDFVITNKKYLYAVSQECILIVYFLIRIGYKEMKNRKSEKSQIKIRNSKNKKQENCKNMEIRKCEKENFKIKTKTYSSKNVFDFDF